jgi:hypothetical protein
MAGGRVVTNCDCCGGGGGSGGCCIDSVCSIETAADCAANGGSYLGDGTSCSGVDCTQGACCLGGACSIEAGADACLGNYLGDGTTCADVDCNQGACCSGGSCSVVPAGSCTGDYLGNGSDCDGVDCGGSSPGACCVSGVCSMLSSAACGSAGGIFHGAGSTCDETDCPCSGACSTFIGFSDPTTEFLTKVETIIYHMTKSCGAVNHNFTCLTGIDCFKVITTTIDPATCATTTMTTWGGNGDGNVEAQNCNGTHFTTSCIERDCTYSVRSNTEKACSDTVAHEDEGCEPASFPETISKQIILSHQSDPGC